MTSEPAREPLPLSFDSLERTAATSDSLAELAERARYACSLAVGTSTICVRFSHARSAAAFTQRYSDLPSSAPADLMVYAVEDGEDAYFWAAGLGRVWHWPGGPLAAEGVGFFADNCALYEFLCASHYIGFHAAVVAGARSAAALIGATTAGKTTTALACVRRGMRFYSDERCILENGLVVPFLRRMTLRRGGRSALLADGVDDDALGLGASLEEWRTFDDVLIRPKRLFGELAGGAPLPLSAVFVIESRGRSPQIVPTAASQVMPQLLSAMASGESGLDRIARVLHELRGVSVFRIRLGAPDDTARAIEAELEIVDRARPG